MPDEQPIPPTPPEPKKKVTLAEKRARKMARLKAKPPDRSTDMRRHASTKHLDEFKFKAGQSGHPGREKSPQISPELIKIIDRKIKIGEYKGSTYRDVLIERYLQAAAGIIKLNAADLAAMENVFNRVEGKPKARDDSDENKSKKITTIIIPALPVADAVPPPATLMPKLTQPDFGTEIPNEHPKS